eukprot:CAMPEP_0179105754 /NCGR_PEP_ID=MMETSP0796-20121207/49129_1 /TAXON_ID=73915 /ORGANISM="Pyrodinium bahamense, Strain pbaha01" /LENGTH=107 /DNA_ID=CAMNT_0020803747 /DNA_START=489 /DNA_END=812 /DNA_ORIENTATION=-
MRPTVWAARASSNLEAISRSSPKISQRCQRGSTGKGTRMLLSRPSLCNFGLTLCMTAASATSAGSSDVTEDKAEVQQQGRASQMEAKEQPHEVCCSHLVLQRIALDN